jgi:hypothetical protein
MAVKLLALGGPYMYESGSRVRLGLISPHTYERGDPHTDEFGSLEPEPSRTREPDSYVYGPPYAPPALPSPTPQEDSWYSFLLEAEPTPGAQCGWKDYVN